MKRLVAPRRPRAKLSAAKASAASQVEYVLLALLEAGGADRQVDIEDIAVAAFKLAPALFRWRNYAEYPSAEVTRMALVHAEEAVGHPLFIRGAGGRSRMLAAAGVARAQEAQLRLGSNRATPTDVTRRPPARDLGRMERHPAVTKWRLSGMSAVSRYDLADLLLCAPSSPLGVFRDRLIAATAVASRWDRDELLRFLNQASDELANIVARREA